MQKKMTPDEIKTVAAGLLFSFDKICKDNGLVYSVGYGTLLGAVRHKGFIPWDDDIDVIMARDQYDKLIELYKNGDPFTDNVEIVSLETKNKYSAPLAKIIDNRTVLYQNKHAEKVTIGVYIDLFVFDKVPEDKRLRQRLYAKQDRCQKFWTISEMKPTKNEKNLIKIGIKKMLNQGAAAFFAKKLNKNAKRSDIVNSNSGMYSNLSYCVYGREKETFDKNLFTQYTDVSFEDHDVLAFKDYDVFLHRIYGNYMEYPPVEKRISNHVFDAFWKN